MHKQRDSDGGKLIMGPVWDFNLGFGNADYCTSGNPEGWVTGFNSICPQDYWLIPFWWDRLYQDPVYRSKLAARWAEVRSNQLQTSRLHTYIDSVYSYLYRLCLLGITLRSNLPQFSTVARNRFIRVA